MFPYKLLYFRHDAYDHHTAGAWATCAELEYSLLVSNGKKLTYLPASLFAALNTFLQIVLAQESSVVKKNSWRL